MSRGTKLCSYFNFYSLYNKCKHQLCRMNGPWFYEMLLGLKTFSGLSRNGPLNISPDLKSIRRLQPLHQSEAKIFQTRREYED